MIYFKSTYQWMECQDRFCPNRDSSVSIFTRLRAVRPRFVSCQGQGMFLFTTTSRPPPIQWVQQGLFLWG